MIFKTITNFKTDQWASYGNVQFFDVATEKEADEEARRAILEKTPDAYNIHVELTPSTLAAVERHKVYMKQLEEWRENVRKGVPQTRRI